MPPATAKKTLVIISCSQKKLGRPAAARDLYQGSLFKLSKEFAERNQYDYLILSAKHGLLPPDQVVAPYDQYIKTKADITRLQQQVLPILRPLLPTLEKVIVIGGSNYRKVLAPLKNGKFEEITDSRGIGGMLQQLRRRLQSAPEHPT